MRDVQIDLNQKENKSQRIMLRKLQFSLAYFKQQHYNRSNWKKIGNNKCFYLSLILFPLPLLILRLNQYKLNLEKDEARRFKSVPKAPAVKLQVFLRNSIYMYIYLRASNECLTWPL